jgi:hypothetical protein
VTLDFNAVHGQLTRYQIQAFVSDTPVLRLDRARHIHETGTIIADRAADLLDELSLLLFHVTLPLSKSVQEPLPARSRRIPAVLLISYQVEPEPKLLKIAFPLLLLAKMAHKIIDLKYR